MNKTIKILLTVFIVSIVVFCFYEFVVGRQVNYYQSKDKKIKGYVIFYPYFFEIKKERGIIYKNETPKLIEHMDVYYIKKVDYFYTPDFLNQSPAIGTYVLSNISRIFINFNKKIFYCTDGDYYYYFNIEKNLFFTYKTKEDLSQFLTNSGVDGKLVVYDPQKYIKNKFFIEKGEGEKPFNSFKGIFGGYFLSRFRSSKTPGVITPPQPGISRPTNHNDRPAGGAP